MGDNETKKNTGLFHDDDGYVDDRRVAGWIILVILIYLGYHAVHAGNATALQLIEVMIWPWMILMGTEVAEKFKPGMK
jgi:hypothetical protein